MLFRRSRTIHPTEAAERHARRELVLIDVREPAELQATGRIKGARNVPLGQLPARLGELDRDVAVAFVCQSGARSAGATRIAAKAGYDACNVRGGVMAWSRAGLPLTR